jgi:hypothetical protein
MNLFEIPGKFEHDCMWFIQTQGYLVRRAIPVVTDARIEDATDIDVWGIKFIPPITRSISIIDCKYRKKPKVYERIVWAKGMSLYAAADQTFVAVPKANWKMIDFGRRGGIRVLTEDEIARYLGTLPIGKRPFGQANFEFYQDFFAKRVKILKADEKIRELLFDARSLYFLGSSITNVNRSIEGLKKAADLHINSNGEHDRQILCLFIACEYLCAFSINLMKVAEETFTLSETDRKGLLEKRLTYGDLPPKKVKEIISLSQRYVLESLQGGKLSKEQKNLEGVVLTSADFKPPEYSSTIQGLLERIIKSSMAYFDGLRALDLILFDYIVRQAPFDLKTLPMFTEHVPTEEAIKIAKNFIVAACDSAKINREPFWVSLPETEDKREVQTPVQMKIEM